MKNRILSLSFTVLFIALSSSIAFGQNKMPSDMKMPDMMAEMMKSPHHAVMMAYQKNALAFAKVLWEMSSEGKIQVVDLARNAFAELKLSLEKMDEIHQLHMSKMGKMDAAMMGKMKPMMAKMDAEKAALKVHILALEQALQANPPNAQDVEMHSAALVMQLEKMKMPDDKMKM